MGVHPKISIVVPNFNKGDLVTECLESVSSQSFQDWELLFIDDNSSDKSYSFAKSFAEKDERIKVLRNNSNVKGANACRNIGIAEASADYLLFFDSDDLMTEDCLQERWEDQEVHSEESVIVHQTGLFYDRLYDSKRVCNIEKDIPHLDRFLARDLVWLISGPLWPRQVLIDLNGFDLKLKSHQEYDLHVRALIEGVEFRFINREPRVFYRQNVVSESRKNSQSVNHLKARVNMKFNHFHLLKENGILNSERKVLIARYLLDIAQMMRWHKNQMGKDALACALQIWSSVYRESIISTEVYTLGKRYIRFKHQMLFNHVPFVQKRLDSYFKKALSGYIHIPSETFCKTEYSQ